MQIAQRHAPPARHVAAVGQGVLQVQRHQVFVVHARWQAGGVGVPGHQVVALVALAHQVFAHLARPHQVARVQELERAAHLLARQEALTLGDVAQQVDLALVDEQAQLARGVEVDLRGQQRQRQRRRQVGVAGHAALARQRADGDRHQRAAQAVAHGVQRRVVGILAGGAHGIEHAQLQVVVHRQVAVRLVRVAPRHHVHRVALADQVAHHRVVRRQIEDVVLHDPRRQDEHRLRVHLVGLRGVADQLHQVVAEHHLTGRDGDIAADHEAAAAGLVLRRRHAADVGGQVLHALEQVGTAGLQGVLEQHRVGQQAIGRRQHVQPLAREEVHQLAVVRAHARHLGGFAPEHLGVAECGAPAVERPLGPFVGAKARIVVLQARAVGAAVLQARGVDGQLRRQRGQLQLSAG